MTDYTPTAQEVRTSYGAAVTFPTMSLPERRRAFDRWLEQVKAGAWDEGYTSGRSNTMRRMSDEPKAPLTHNPYRQETQA